MNSFGEYLREKRENLGLILRKVAAELDIIPSILSKIERHERKATKEMIPMLSKSLETSEQEMEIEFVKSSIFNDLGELKYLKIGIIKPLESLK